MLQLPTVILRHTTRHDRHHDWLLADPADPTGPLWTARITAPPAQWPALRRWDVQPIAAHRRRYLVYQGPISEGRGQVVRVAAGTYIPELWTRSRIIVRVRLDAFVGRIDMHRRDADHWLARLVDEPRRDED